MSDDPPEPTPPPSAAPQAGAESATSAEGTDAVLAGDASAEPLALASVETPPLAASDGGEVSPVTGEVRSAGVAPPASPTLASRARQYAFAVIPAIAVLELVAHLIQTHTVVSEREWLAARDAVRAVAKPDDLVVVAPYWADPIGRELFKDELLSVAREARPDATRFPRAVEVSIRGQHLAELGSWKVASKKRVGPVTLTTYENPSYVPLKDDLVSHVAPGKMSVSAVGNGAPAECTFTRGRVETGGLGFGPAVPAERFTCPGGGMLGATVMQPGDYRPHRCLFTPPLGGGKTMRVRFENVTFGTVLHGHAGIDWDSTAHTDEPPVTLVWKLGDRTIGRIVAGNDDGWKSFELDTRDVDGQTGEITAEVSSPSSHNRLYCFEADTR